MLDSLLNILAPHYCYGCGKIGTPLCQNCKYDITGEPFSGCVACGEGLVERTGICASCQVPYSQAWCVGVRQDGLERLIDAYKFHNAKASAGVLAGLLNATLPVLPVNTVIVPVPTVSSHIRQRGYDHMELITKRFAASRHLQHATPLSRRTSTKQRDAGRSERIKQAKEAFECISPLDEDAIYLLVDDVVTTGATIKYAAKALHDAGARQVWVAAISRQTLD